MKISYTSRVTKPSPSISVENLSSQLSFYGVTNSSDIVSSLKSLINTSSIYSLLEVVLESISSSEATIGLLAIEKVIRASTINRQAFLQNTYREFSGSILSSLSEVKDQAALSNFLINYLGIADFNVDGFYSSPYSLSDWVAVVDIKYTGLLLHLRELNLFSFFLELIKVRSDSMLEEYPQHLNLLATNINSEFYKNVLGATPKLYII